MRQSVRRLLFSAGVVAAVGAAVCGQGAVASAAKSAPGGRAIATAPAAPYVPPSKPLYVGERGTAVKSVQRRLAQLHYYPGPIDGSYGQDVLEAAWAFREVQGLPMNASTAAEPITRAFELDLVHPHPPFVLIRKGPKNRIEINQNIEVLVLYRNDTPEVILHVSSGGGYYYPCPGNPSATCGPAITPDGNYKALWFYNGWETVPLGTMYNPVFFIGSAYAIHGDIPVPWYPASHGCVRIWMDAATWFHNKLTVGGAHATPIYVRGTAPYLG